MSKDELSQNKSSSSLGDDWEIDTNILASEVNTLSVNEEERISRWTRLLGVTNTPNPLDNWDQLYNLNNQCALRNDCRKLANVLKNTRSVPELESFLTLYCKNRGTDYIKNIGWVKILENIMLLNIPQTHEFNVFFAFTTKYIPKDLRPQSELYNLFHLLLQYHDPQLSNYLDSLHCYPALYSKSWFGTLFSSSLSTEACLELWTLYIEQGDPFLVFYLAIVFLINSKEELLQLEKNEKEKALEILERNGTQLSPEDVTDFFQLALYYAKNTPESVRRSFHHLIFGINFDEESNSVRLKELLCLPILGIDLTSKEEISSGAVNFFIIDTRSDSDFDSGHYVSSFNLDCGAMVDEPEKFAIALNSLENYKASRRPEDHYTILGYGTDEQDKYTNMLVAMLVQKSKAHVSFIEGGFKLMHDSIARSNRWELISMHSEVSCKLCNKEKVTPKWSLISKVKSAMSSTSSRMKERVEAVVFPIENETPEKSVTHVSSEQRHEKRYRQQSVFTIDEHSDDDSESAAVDENLKEEILLSKEFTETFECKEIFRDQNINGHIALTRTHLYVLHDVLDKKGYVTTKARHALSTIVAVTSRKSVPELLTFKLGYEMNGLAKITAVHKLYVPKAGECAKAVKLAIYALRPYTGPDN